MLEIVSANILFLKSYDEGRISIFIVRPNTKESEEKVSIYGRQSGARFGQALVALGDLVKRFRVFLFFCQCYLVGMA